jgi:Flp pilus assembly pilin Flp
MMQNKFMNFWRDESGAVTVDWVVLTALIVALSLAVFGIFRVASTQSVTNMFSSF